MKVRTVKDLTLLLEIRGLSPEALGSEISISNMTLRRLLRNPPEHMISEKYWAQLDRYTMKVSGFNFSEPKYDSLISEELIYDFETVLTDLKATGSHPVDIKKMNQEVRAKSKSFKIGAALKEKLKILLSAAIDKNGSATSRAIAVGALLYFLNPMDLIPDTIPGIGFLDDFAVTAVAISAIIAEAKKKQTNKNYFEEA